MHEPMNVEVADRDWSGSISATGSVATMPEVDVVVVGGGIAGWTAACRASELGASVALVEKATTGPGGGNSLLSGGVFHAAYQRPDDPPATLRDVLCAKVDGAARDDVLDAWASNVARARNYLASNGGRFYQPLDGPHFANVLHPFRLYAATTTRDLVRAEAWRGMGPHVLLTNMHDIVAARGGHFLGGARARALVHEGRRLAGVEIEMQDGSSARVRGRAVILADGGFQANTQLVAQHITPAYVLRGSHRDEGDALLMALEAGAKAANLDAFYGHVLHRDALTNAALWPDPNPEALVDNGIVVDDFGRRFVDERRGNHPWSHVADKVAGAVARSETPGGCWLVVDEQLWETVGRQGLGAAMNPTIEEEGALLIRADTVEDLAAQAKLPVGALKHSIDGFDRYAVEGVMPEPPRSGPARPLTPPFVAIPLIVGITFTMGGVLVDAHGRALDQNEQPIPGLYAAGGTMAGLQGGPRNGYSGGWSEASTFGLLAGEHAAQWLSPTSTSAVGTTSRA